MVFIACPACLVRYVIKKEHIGVMGRNVQCTRCNHLWFQAPIDDTLNLTEVSENDFNNTVKGKKHLPKVLDSDNQTFYKFSSVFLILLIILSSGILYQDQIKDVFPIKIYDMFMQYDTSGLMLSDIMLLKHEVDSRHVDLSISGKITNHSDQIRHLPLFRANIFDDRREKMISVTTHLDTNVMLKPGEVYNLRKKITHVPVRGAKVLLLDMGNRFELLLR